MRFFMRAMMLCLWAPVLILCSVSFTNNPAKWDLVSHTLGCTRDPCVVTLNFGGKVSRFEAAAGAIKSGARSRIIVDGDCYSACTLVLDRVADKTCLDASARLYFHRGERTEFKRIEIPMGKIMMYARFFHSMTHFDVDYRLPGIVQWIRSIHGLPREGQFVEMPAGVARRIWPTCQTPR
jgi:hypothetical protein